MKTIVKIEKNVSFFVMEDTTEVILTDKYIKFDNKIILDMNNKNSYLIENTLPVPEDWESQKYLYFEKDIKNPFSPWGWVLNPEWIEPKKEDEV